MPTNVVPALKIPFQRPSPARLSDLSQSLREIEDSGIYTNYGPVNARLERQMTSRLFDNKGASLTVNNATIGLILAIKEAISFSSRRRFALMPSFTFAATAHAALWAGLTPLFCDIDADNWNLCKNSEDQLLQEFGDQIACIVPYACFGNSIDLDRYDALSRIYKCGIVVDAAASLGTKDVRGAAFGAGFPHAIVFSMHATKTFASGEAGLIHTGDLERLNRLRTMGNFGFGRPREATMPGLNSKLSEIGALSCLSKLNEFEAIVTHRASLAKAYREFLDPAFSFQDTGRSSPAYQFMPVLLPEDRSIYRQDIIARMQVLGIGCAHYFSPHLAKHDYFRDFAAGPLDTTELIAARSLSLPLSDHMTIDEVEFVSKSLNRALSDSVILV